MSIFKLTIGNPQKEGSGGISKSETGSPFIGGIETENGSQHLFDADGNIFLEASKDLYHKGKTLFEDLENKNVVIADAYVLQSLNTALSAIESIFVSAPEINFTGNNLTINADSTAQIFAPNILLGKVNTDILNATTDGEQYTDPDLLYTDLSNYDFVLINKFFAKWWNTYMVPMLVEYKDLRDKYQSHTHSFSVPSPSTLEQVSTDISAKAKNINNLIVSKTVKAI